MFTGIIQDIGLVESIIVKDNSLQLGISTILAESHLELGASVACNGCCLTVVNVIIHNEKKCINDINIKKTFYVDLGPETLAVTRFAQIKVGDKINLEPALRMGDALGGHLVSGHIDGIFEIFSFNQTEDGFWKLSVLIPKKYSKYIILKGSIAISGISLTIANIYSHPNSMVCIEFMIIPHTYCNTNLQFIHAGNSFIELEFDQSTKTIASLVEGMINNYSQMIT